MNNCFCHHQRRWKFRKPEHKQDNAFSVSQAPQTRLIGQLGGGSRMPMATVKAKVRMKPARMAATTPRNLCLHMHHHSSSQSRRMCTKCSQPSMPAALSSCMSQGSSQHACMHARQQVPNQPVLSRATLPPCL